MDDPGVRLALFLSLDPHELKAFFPMMRYIHDPHELVRMAAVAVVAANPSEAELMEIRNIMESASPEKKDLVAAIIEGRAMTLFDALLSSDAFTQLSSDYLSFIASDSVRKEWTGFLSKTGRKVLARSILSNAQTKDALQGKKVFVVDESMMVRRYMERKLHEMNLSPQGFSSYEQVLKAISSSKPALLLCGLLVAGASCFPFIDQVRTVYGGETTPVMLVSTGIDPGAALFRDPSKKGDVEGVFRLPAPDPLFRKKIQTLLSQK
jgi:PleD family two-component response regulator